ncbi:MAG: sensor histidine kinase, partial [Chloroflexota bacterium]|nr:sensor histidine kinase [Chloroflexota bacterium]
NGGSGLRGMRDRAKLVGAELSITSEVGQGTEIRLRLASRTATTGKAGT